MKKHKQKLAVIPTMAVLFADTITANAASITIPGTQMQSLGTPPNTSELSGFFGSFKTVGTAIGGICAITSLIFFVISIAKLSTSAGNDMQRSRAIKGILYSGVSLALFGGITVIAGMFWNAI